MTQCLSAWRRIGWRGTLFEAPADEQILVGTGRLAGGGEQEGDHAEI